MGYINAFDYFLGFLEIFLMPGEAMVMAERLLVMD